MLIPCAFLSLCIFRSLKPLFYFLAYQDGITDYYLIQKNHHFIINIWCSSEKPNMKSKILSCFQHRSGWFILAAIRELILPRNSANTKSVSAAKHLKSKQMKCKSDWNQWCCSLEGMNKEESLSFVSSDSNATVLKLYIICTRYYCLISNLKELMGLTN